MRSSRPRTIYLTIIASVLLSTLGTLLASAQICASCLRANIETRSSDANCWRVTTIPQTIAVPPLGTSGAAVL
jgi:hypothetical protein